MNFAVYDEQTGRILRWGVVPLGSEHLQAMAPGEAVVAQPVRNADLDYVTAFGVAPRPDFPGSLSRTEIVADGVDAAELTGLPDPCILIIGGVEKTVAGGAATIRSNRPASIEIACRHWPHLEWRTSITAVAP